MEELLDDISIANNDVIVADDFRDDVNYFKLRRQRVGNTDKKQGLWKTMLIKIGVKHKKKVKRTISNEQVDKKVEEESVKKFKNDVFNDEKFRDDKIRDADFHKQDADKKKKSKFPKLPKKLNVFKSLRMKKSQRKASVYQSFKNDHPKEEDLKATREKMEENDAEESRYTYNEGNTYKEEINVIHKEEGRYTHKEEPRYMGRKVHLEMHSESYDLLEESGYETTSNSPVPHVTPVQDTEFWSIEDVSDDRQQIVGSDSEDEFRNANEGAFQRGWKSARAKTFRRSLRKSGRQTWKGLRQSLRHQVTFPTANSVMNAVGANKRR